MPTKNTQKTSIDIKPKNVVKPISTNKKVDTTGSIKTVLSTKKTVPRKIQKNTVHTIHTPKSIISTSTKKISDSIFFPTSERPGTLIIVEGSDGSGKSTQLLIAKNLLESN
jgi:Tfp pilus assembly pilus retraction ATPase PilT